MLFVWFFSLAATLLASSAGSTLASNNFSLNNVRVSTQTLSPGEEVLIFYRLTQDARVSIRIFDPDYAVVRTLIDEVDQPAGTNTVVWDGRDDFGEMVPNEAYLFTILAEGRAGQQAIYDPTSHSGGEPLHLGTQRVERSDGKVDIHYAVPAAARISIRAGVSGGPLLKTILDWKAQPQGGYIQAWDGLDNTGWIRVLDQAGGRVDVRGHRLPENTIIVQGNTSVYPTSYPTMSGSASGQPGRITQAAVRQSALQRGHTGMYPEYLIPRSLNVAPRFIIYRASGPGDDTGNRTANSSGRVPLAQKALTDAAGNFDFTLEVAPESLPGFNEHRYEIVVFVDNQLFDEEETAYSPYTYSLDTRRLANGSHTVSINLANLTGQIGTYSFTLYVNN